MAEVDARTSRALATTYSLVSGLRFWGIVEEPTCWLDGSSLTSAISVACRRTISLAIRSAAAESSSRA
jgi:hypothetical protein